MDRGEVVEEAAQREVREEVGVEVAIEQLIGLYSTAGEPVILAVYASRIVGGELRPGPEMREVGVFSPDALPRMAFPHDRRIIADWRLRVGSMADGR